MFRVKGTVSPQGLFAMPNGDAKISGVYYRMVCIRLEPRYFRPSKRNSEKWNPRSESEVKRAGGLRSARYASHMKKKNYSNLIKNLRVETTGLPAKPHDLKPRVFSEMAYGSRPGRNVAATTAAADQLRLFRREPVRRCILPFVSHYRERPQSVRAMLQSAGTPLALHSASAQSQSRCHRGE